MAFSLAHLQDTTESQTDHRTLEMNYSTLFETCEKIIRASQTIDELRIWIDGKTHTMVALLMLLDELDEEVPHTL